MRVCLDFDDTLCGPRDEPLPGAREALDALHAAGWELVVSSARFDPLYGEALPARLATVDRWLRRHDFPPARVSELVPEADCYVDDRALRLSGDWETDATRILQAAGPRWRSQRGRVSVLFEDAWDFARGEPAPGAPAALRRLAGEGCELILIAPGLPPALGSVALRSHGFPALRVTPHKLASRVYASRRARRFEGDWAAFRLEG